MQFFDKICVAAFKILVLSFKDSSYARKLYRVLFRVIYFINF